VVLYFAGVPNVTKNMVFKVTADQYDKESGVAVQYYTDISVPGSSQTQLGLVRAWLDTNGDLQIFTQ
jgi:hypothetical protein